MGVRELGTCTWTAARVSQGLSASWYPHITMGRVSAWPLHRLAPRSEREGSQDLCRMWRQQLSLTVSEERVSRGCGGLLAPALPHVWFCSLVMVHAGLGLWPNRIISTLDKTNHNSDTGSLVAAVTLVIPLLIWVTFTCLADMPRLWG